MDEQLRNALCDQTLIDNRDHWFREMTNYFYGDRKGPLYLAGLGADAVHGDLMYTDPEAWLQEGLTYLAQHAQNKISD